MVKNSKVIIKEDLLAQDYGQYQDIQTLRLNN